MTKMEHDTSEWHNFFSDFNVYTNSVRLKVFIDAIRNVVDKKKPILEVGSGSGATARILADIGYKIVATDYDADVVKGLKNSSHLPEERLTIHQMDMLDITYEDKTFGAVIHQGLLEHFDDQSIVTTLKEQGRVADWVVFDVPNNRDDEQHYGDERFLPLSHWKKLFDEAGLELVEYYGRMPPVWTYIFPHAFFTNKRGIFSLLGKLFGKSYIFICKKKY
ncbi:hypothetical protein R50073_26890 [Maricurvus nonylphenolicus]|uniref:class I SAM-dependent methyltransferase n=1 Tax=Maricurvus nonylphenolicus TaxID=1008307 RepID=UPI0036F38356